MQRPDTIIEIHRERVQDQTVEMFSGDKYTESVDGTGYSAYKVANSVTSHEAWGLGSYVYFNVNPAVHTANGFEAPANGGVKLHDIFTISLASGTADHVVNNIGAPAQASSVTPQNVTNFP